MKLYLSGRLCRFYRAEWTADAVWRWEFSPSVRLCLIPNACIATKQKKDLSKFFIPYERSFSLIFWKEEWLVGGDPLYLKLWVNRSPLERNRRFWTHTRSRASAVKPSVESSFNTNKKSTVCIPMSLRWSSYVTTKPPKGGSKTQNGRFSCKIALRLKKVCYNVFCVKSVSNKVVRHPLAKLFVQKWLVIITPKRYEIGCQLVLITNKKSHTGFRLVPASMTLNELERPKKKRVENSPYFVFFHRIR